MTKGCPRAVLFVCKKSQKVAKIIFLHDLFAYLQFLLYLCTRFRAAMVESVDTKDLKSFGQWWLCGFKSRSRYWKTTWEHLSLLKVLTSWLLQVMRRDLRRKSRSRYWKKRQNRMNLLRCDFVFFICRWCSKYLYTLPYTPYSKSFAVFLKKCYFLRFFLFSFCYPFLNFTLRRPWEHRENSLTPPTWKKCVLLRLLLSICLVLANFPANKSPAFTPYTLHSTPEKSPSKAIFLAQFKKMYYLCTVNQRRGCLTSLAEGSRHIKKAFISALFWPIETSQLSSTFRT